MSKIVSFKCKVCGKKVSRLIYPSYRSKPAYCSSKCSGRGTRGRRPPNYVPQRRRCRGCGKFFHSPPSTDYEYCSSSCYYKTRRRSGRCIVCGTPLAFAKWEWRGLEERACSRICGLEYMLALRNAKWMDARTEKACEICGTPIVRPKSLSKGLVVCSKSCASALFSRLSTERWKSSSYHERVLTSIYKGNAARPTRPEEMCYALIRELGLPFSYNGDGTFVVDGLRPDFVYRKGKRVIEVFGILWHDPKDVLEKRTRYRKAGWRIHVIWETDLYENLPRVATRLMRFWRSL